MKLVQLELHNYAYWEDLTVDFTNQQDKPTACSKIILCGEQESGKSTITRSLRWLLYGDFQKPPDDYYPFSWKRQQQDTQFVRGVFIHPKEGRLILTRTRAPGSNNTVRTLSVKGEEKPAVAVPKSLYI